MPLFQQIRHVFLEAFVQSYEFLSLNKTEFLCPCFSKRRFGPFYVQLDWGIKDVWTRRDIANIGFHTLMSQDRFFCVCDRALITRLSTEVLKQVGEKKEVQGNEILFFDLVFHLISYPHLLYVIIGSSVNLSHKVSTCCTQWWNLIDFIPYHDQKIWCETN